MRQIETPNGYLAIEYNGGIDVYMDDCFVCELQGKTFANFAYDESVDVDKLDEAIEDALDTQKIMDKLSEC